MPVFMAPLLPSELNIAAGRGELIRGARIIRVTGEGRCQASQDSGRKLGQTGIEHGEPSPQSSSVNIRRWLENQQRIQLNVRGCHENLKITVNNEVLQLINA